MGFEAFDRVLGDTKFSQKIRGSQSKGIQNESSVTKRENIVTQDPFFFGDDNTTCENMYCLGSVESINVIFPKNKIEQIEFIHVNKKKIMRNRMLKHQEKNLPLEPSKWKLSTNSK